MNLIYTDTWLTKESRCLQMSIDSIESISKTPCYLANSKTRRKINLQIKRDEKTHDCDRADRQSWPCEEEVGTYLFWR